MYNFLVSDFISTHKWTFVLYIIIVVCFFPLESILLPNIYGYIIDSIKTDYSADNFFDIITNIKSMNYYGGLALLSIVWAIIHFAYSAKSALETSFFPEYVYYLRTNIFNKVIRSHMDKYTDIKSGDYLTRVLEYTKTCSTVFQLFISRLLPETTIIIIIIIYMLFKNNTVGLIYLVTTLLILAIQYYCGSDIIDTTKKREYHFNKIIGTDLHEKLDNLMNVYISNDHIDTIVDNDKNERKQQEFSRSYLVLIDAMLLKVNMVLLCGYILSLYNVNNIVELLVSGQYLSLQRSQNEIVLDVLLPRIGILDSNTEYMNKLLDVHTITGANDNGITKGEIEFKDVVYAYDGDTCKSPSNVLSCGGVTLTVRGGSSVCLIGDSGSGKTTLMKLLVRLFSPKSGSIYIDGRDIQEYDIEYLRDSVNYMTQRSNLFDLSVTDNIRYGNDVSDAEIVKILTAYDLLDIFTELDGGIDGMCGVNGSNLSGGMQKIVLLLRTILKGGVIKVLDEPLAGLDKRIVKRVIALIMDNTKNNTLIVISHDSAIYSYMDKVVDLQNL
jgi:ABC-type multidrug transport system fused ATPase/permease subunit